MTRDEAIARALFPILTHGSDYEDVPIEEWDRPRYSHLRRNAEVGARHLIAELIDVGIKIIAIEPAETMVEIAAAASWEARHSSRWKEVSPGTQASYREVIRNALRAALGVAE